MSFAEACRAGSARDWDAAVNHPFVDQLLDGTLPDDRLRHYLVQDYQFCDAFVILLGAAVATAPGLGERLRFARVLGAFAADEDDYFTRSFDELGVPLGERAAPELARPTREFDALMREAAGSRSYPVVLAVLLVAEWLYGDWAARGRDRDLAALAPRHRDWIRLHDNPDYNAWVDWLRAEFDNATAAADAEPAAQAFARAVRLERAFFDDALIARTA